MEYSDSEDCQKDIRCEEYKFYELKTNDCMYFSKSSIIEN